MKKINLHNIKTSGHKTPEKYFESFDDRLFSKLRDGNELDTIKSAGFKVPNDYFETVNDKILSKLENKNEAKVIPLFSLKKVAYVSAIAASLVLMFNVVFNTPEKVTYESLEIASIENYLVEEDFTSYEFASLLTEDELNSEVFTNTDISEESLEDYLLDNANIEDLLIE
ncbi:hypothetical protein [Jejuia spongiicola]|uniref:Anti sigma-E protein RseA N-terminal domain-containing protein n=1 Tax=Jejuia spongiicola TaxID=2942207 RepID=A0ABT0QDS3_9FLAO|nr:hypothetical protein [Jejuia spongiicola]MCL6294394.1 hypothetical protein [Jejuia spongiicola]